MQHALMRDETPPGLACLSGMRPCILLVDDQMENLILTERMLKPLGALIFKALSGREALSLLERHVFAMVLLDVHMPEMDGFQTAKRMQAQGARGVPIVFLTALGQEDRLAQKAAEIGAADFIFKPVNAEILKSKIRVYLELYVQRQQILELNSHLHRSNEELERFAHICSHDMQEPVRMMNSYAQLLTKKYASLLDENGRKYLDFITGNASHIQKMIQDILAFCSIGKDRFEIVEVDASALLDEILGGFEYAIAATGASVSVGEMPRLLTSPILLHMLLHNLICNALKFQPKGQKPIIAISAVRQPGEWRFCVRDNGIGLPAEASDKVFTMFQRLHRREEYPGTGIGLSTCKKFIELYGGNIWFESGGQGSEFYFTIPQELPA